MLIYTFLPGKNNEAWRIKTAGKLIDLLCAALGGALCSAAFAPLNFAPASIIAFAVLMAVCYGETPQRAALYGWVWGFAWSLISFFWLREINFAVPFLLAPVLGIFAAVWAFFIPLFTGFMTVPNNVVKDGFEAVKSYRCGNFAAVSGAAACAAGYVLIFEYSRSMMLPWNYLSSSLWRTPELLGILPFTGSWPVSFVIAMSGISLGLAAVQKRRMPFVFSVILMTALFAAGALFRPHFKPGREVKTGLVQGDISQRRDADDRRAQEALDVYLHLTGLLAAGHPEAEVILWPETAVPYPFFAAGEVSSQYRRGVAELLKKGRFSMIIGTLDFVLSPGRRSVKGMTNSALLILPGGRVSGKFDKVHRVPFGEYIPFRKYLPQCLVNLIDMNRDLIPGGSFTPLAFAPDGRAGMMICFEDVFPYVPAQEVKRGANILFTITNDAWYPHSCEPEQHLANSVFRAIENNLYFVRAGNNSGSCVISPYGKIVQTLDVPGEGRAEIRRGCSAGVLSAYLPEEHMPTFYARHGDYIMLVFGGIFAAALLTVFCKWLELRRSQGAIMEKHRKNSAENGTVKTDVPAGKR